jgi:ribosomal protein S18 acetylase RimI-like enzyme
VLTARRAGPERTLLGVARGVTDFAWCCYISELAVSASAQGLGVGKALLEEARRQIGPDVALFLASVPDAVGFYERIGMVRLADTFWFPRQR